MENQEKTRILVAINQSSKKGYPTPSKRSKAAFEWILDIVRANVGRFNLQFVHVQNPNNVDVQDANNTSDDDNEAVDMLEYFEFECHKIGVANVSWIAQGLDPKEVICTQVEQRNADLLVMGSGKLGSFRRFFNRGESVSAYCLKHADCPVITVNEKAAKRHIVLQELRQTSSM